MASDFLWTGRVDRRGEHPVWAKRQGPINVCQSGGKPLCNAAAFIPSSLSITLPPCSGHGRGRNCVCVSASDTAGIVTVVETSLFWYHHPPGAMTFADIFFCKNLALYKEVLKHLRFGLSDTQFFTHSLDRYFVRLLCQETY